MKKILFLILAVACVFTMISCDKSDPALKAFTTAVDNTKPAVVSVDTTLTTVRGELLSNATTTFAEDGSFTLVYWYEHFNTVSEGGSDDVKVKVENTVTCDKDGNYSAGGESVATAANTGYKIKLDAKKIAGYKIDADGDILSVTVKAADTKAVLGVEIASDVTVVLSKNADKIVSLTLNYVIEAGTVEVVCNYK